MENKVGRPKKYQNHDDYLKAKMEKYYESRKGLEPKKRGRPRKEELLENPVK